MNKIKAGFWLNQIIGTILFMVGIFACYYGAMKQLQWLGFTVVLVIMIIDLLQNKAQIKQKLRLVILVGLSAAIIESVLIATSVYSVVSSSRLFNIQWIIPIWILALWLNFIVRVTSYVFFTRGRHFINAILGAVFALLIFRSGTQMGLINLRYGIYSMAIVAIVWAIFVPFIYAVTNKLFPILKK